MERKKTNAVDIVETVAMCGVLSCTLGAVAMTVASLGMGIDLDTAFETICKPVMCASFVITTFVSGICMFR